MAMTSTDRHERSNGQGQGMNWITPKKRLAIYLRDGLACCYCGSTIEDGAKLTLDHLVAHSDGGSNDATNLVTACHKCNSSRGNRPWKIFAAKVAAYVNHDVKAADIVKHIRSTALRTLDVAEAEAIINRRGGFSAALQFAIAKEKR